MVPRAFSRAVVVAGTANEARLDLLYRQNGQLKVETIFCHESSERGGTAPDGRAREPGAAGIPAIGYWRCRAR
jgi:hypothetical protein